jgi:hypothetical protein
MNERPVLYQLIEAKLDVSLADFVGSRRPQWSWRQLAAEVTVKTGVAVSHEALRTWFVTEGVAA